MLSIATGPHYGVSRLLAHERAALSCAWCEARHGPVSSPTSGTVPIRMRCCCGARLWADPQRYLTASRQCAHSAARPGGSCASRGGLVARADPHCRGGDHFQVLAPVPVEAVAGVSAFGSWRTEKYGIEPVRTACKGTARESIFAKREGRSAKHSLPEAEKAL